MADEQKPVDIQAPATPEVAKPSENSPAPAPAPAAPKVEATPAMPSMPKTEGPAASVVPDLTPKAVAPTPEAPKADAKKAEPAKPGAEGENNVFTELFGQDKAMKEEGMVHSVMGQQDKAKKGFFGKKPGLEDPKKEETGVKRKPGKAVLQGAIALLILTAGFFTTQNSPSFTLLGANPAQKALQAEEQVGEIQGEIHVQNHLAAILLLDKYMTLADEYFYNLAQSESAYVSSNKREDHAETAEELQPELLSLIAMIQERLADDPSGDEMQFAKTAADEFIEQLKEKEGDVDEDTLRQEIHDFETAKKLMQSQSYKDLITGINTEEATDEELHQVFEEYSAVNTSIASIIAQVKEDRIAWSLVVDELEDVIKDVDPLFNTEFTGNLSIATVKYSRDQIDVSGKSITDDTKNFTLISNLIDTFEAADLFTEVEERSYAKNNSGEDSYSGSFRLDMKLNIEKDE